VNEICIYIYLLWKIKYFRGYNPSVVAKFEIRHPNPRIVSPISKTLGGSTYIFVIYINRKRGRLTSVGQILSIVKDPESQI